jgi:hypothetical protein
MKDSASVQSQITFLYYHNLEAAASFHGDVMGFPLREDQEWTKIYCIGPAEVRECCRTDDTGKRLPRAAKQQLPMSARAYADPAGSDRILKLARTIADPSMPQGKPGGQR